MSEVRRHMHKNINKTAFLIMRFLVFVFGYHGGAFNKYEKSNSK